MEFECFTRGTQIIEADTAEEASRIFAELVASEPTEEFIAAIPLDDEE